MGTFVLGVRVLLAVVFATAGVGKLLDKFGTRKALYDFHVPGGAIRFLAVALPLAELAAAVALLFPASARFGAALALVLLSAFMFGIGRALARGETPDCHCFGQIHSAPAGPSTLVRNGLLAALAVVVIWRGPGPSIQGWISDRSAEELVAVGAGIAAVGLGAFAASLWSINRVLRTRLKKATEELASLPAGLPVGFTAPEFSLRDVNGETQSLTSIRERGRPVLLVFAGADCGACKLLMPDVGRWQDTLSDQLSIAVLGNGSPEENLPEAEEHGISDFLLQEAYEVMMDYRVHATPAAVVVNPDGRIADETALGMAAVEPLVRLTLQRGGESLTIPVASEQPEV